MSGNGIEQLPGQEEPSSMELVKRILAVGEIVGMLQKYKGDPRYEMLPEEMKEGARKAYAASAGKYLRLLDNDILRLGRMLVDPNDPFYEVAEGSLNTTAGEIAAKLRNKAREVDITDERAVEEFSSDFFEGVVKGDYGTILTSIYWTKKISKQ